MMKINDDASDDNCDDDYNDNHDDEPIMFIERWDDDDWKSLIIHKSIDFCKNFWIFRLQVLTSGLSRQTKEQKNCWDKNAI